MNRLIDCLALFTHCEPRFFGNPKTCLNANVQWVYSFLSVSWFPTCPPFFCTWCAATASAMSLGWTELAPSVISSKHKVLPEDTVFFEALEAGNLQKKRKGFFRFQGVSWWIFRKWAGKSTRKGPERASILNLPQLSHLEISCQKIWFTQSPGVWPPLSRYGDLRLNSFSKS